MNNGKLLVLGSDYGTLDLVKEGQRMGLYVIAADLMETSPTKAAADEAWLISTTDIEELAKRCTEKNVIGVVTGASDFNTTQSRKLCKRLGLKHYCEDDNAWEIGKNKRLFKDICAKVGAPIAKDYTISVNPTEEELNSVSFPVVVKPVDASGNRGMSYCNNKQELVDACKFARSISTNPTIIVEKELKGPEFAAHYVVAEGEARLLWFGSEHHQPGQKNNLYSLVYTTSAHLKQYLEEVNDKIIEAFREVGCKDGIAWIECIRDNDGHFYCFEMGYRFGATMLYTQYEKVSGFNSIRWMIECAINKKHTIADLPQGLSVAHKSISASYHLFADQEGIVDHIEGLDKIEAMSNVIVDLPKRGGNTARYHSCIGVLRIFAEDCDHLCKTMSEINSLLLVSNAEGLNMVIKFDDFDSVKEEYNIGLAQMNSIRGGV